MLRVSCVACVKVPYNMFLKGSLIGSLQGSSFKEQRRERVKEPVMCCAWVVWRVLCLMWCGVGLCVVCVVGYVACVVCVVLCCMCMCCVVCCVVFVVLCDVRCVVGCVVGEHF